MTGGKQFGDKGFFVEPTIFVDVKDQMKIAQEEVGKKRNSQKSWFSDFRSRDVHHQVWRAEGPCAEGEQHHLRTGGRRDDAGYGQSAVRGQQHPGRDRVVSQKIHKKQSESK